MTNTIFVNGTFDVLHPGHIALLKYARSLGDQLIVAIDSDERVNQLKGSSRPFFNQEERRTMLEELRCVNMVLIFESDKELEAFIVILRPDIMVVGSDWENKKVIGSEYARELRFYDRIAKYSTTKIIQNLTDR